MAKKNRYQPEDTGKVLEEVLAEQASHFTGVVGQLDPKNDEAFWRVNQALLDALRKHNASLENEPPK